MEKIANGRNRMQKRAATAGVLFSQIGFFLLAIILLYGFFTMAWHGVLGLPSVICWTACCAAGISLMAAGGKVRVPGILQAVAGTTGLVAALYFKGPEPLFYIVEGAAALLCIAGYILGLTWTKPERLRSALNVSTVVFLGACLVLVVNAVSYGTYSRMDWTSTRFYEISDSTKDVLRGLEKDLKITVFMRPQVLEMGSEATNPIYAYTSELLERLRDVNSRRITVEWFDPDWERKAVETLLQKYGISQYEVENTLGIVVMEYGDGFHKYLTSHDLAHFDILVNPVTQMQMRRLKSFTGEAAILAALKGLMEEKQTKLYFLYGHGEKDIESPDPMQGLSILRTLLVRENLSVRKIEDIGIDGIPSDCDVLVIPGPRQEIRMADRKAIERYFERGGNLILLLDPLAERGGTTFALTGLEKTVEKWGVHFHNDIVTAWSEILGIPSRVHQVPASPRTCGHPIIDELRDAGITFQFEAPRSMTIDGSGSVEAGMIAAPVAKTSRKFWGETDLASYRSNTDKQDEDDYAGPLTVAVAVGETPLAGKEPIPRAVIFGDSDFLRDDLMTGGNLDVFMNSVYWLSRSPVRREMMGIAPKEPERVKFEITKDKVNSIVLPITVGMPLAILLIGAFVWWRRR